MYVDVKHAINRNHKSFWHILIFMFSICFFYFVCVFQTTILCLEREEAHAPGDQAEEGRPLVDEVKEGQRFWVPVTFNL